MGPSRQIVDSWHRMPVEQSFPRRETLAQVQCPRSVLPARRRESSPLLIARSSTGVLSGGFEIKQNEIVDLLELGSGFGGVVFKSIHLPTGRIMARKMIAGRIVSAKTRKSLAAELAALTRCESPFVVKFYGVCLSQLTISLFMEYMDLGSLERILKLHGPIPERILAVLARSVLRGLIYLHQELNTIHRDLKPGNILLSTKGDIKLCDFGESVELVNSMAKSLVGTTGYMAPERVCGHHYSVKSDIWSLGLTLVELATGVYPYSLPEAARLDIKPAPSQDRDNVASNPSVVELWETINAEAPPKLSRAQFSPEFGHFVEWMLSKDPRERPSPYELMNHSFVADSEQAQASYREWLGQLSSTSPLQPRSGDNL